MMDLDLWNDDFLLAREWGLDMPAVQLGGQYGDLKPEGRLDGDISQSSQLQGAIEESTSGNEDTLSIEWMESSDLGSFLDALGGIPLAEDSLLNLTNSIAPEDCSFKQPQGIQESPLGDIKSEGVISQVDFDALVYTAPSPDSPVQVAPVIKLECYDAVQGTLSPVPGDSGVFSPEEFVVSGAGSIENPFSPEQVLNSPLSADDVDSLLSSPGPSSPESSFSSIIETSPELYKIITTSAAQRKFSPYECSKAKQSTKSTKGGRTRKPAEPVPEHIIMEHVNKKDRKKLQNKNAAIRYRMKKKEEATTIKSEVQELEEINDSLKTKVEDLSREIKYMKNLMEEVCKAKGIVIN